ncbi:hypothetical protein KP509_17G020200 [Ceratopteris richardii]|uniref:4-hydroxyphenylpyruvate dioxygenase n=1 Tax=Ceratopteris richardii TaxID=49495 RepID=A0A8T2SWI0_CERRI|nr:hypothetical protein KP509_17G020200 [Ceratopteris richardii]
MAIDQKPAFALVGCQKFVRKNPLSDRFKVHRFHHIEFWCGDATNTWRRFSWGLGMSLVAKSDQTTGNQTYCSYVLQSNDLVFAFSAPYSQAAVADLSPEAAAIATSKTPHTGWNSDDARNFFKAHGFGARAVGVLVEDAEEAFKVSVANGAIPVYSPERWFDVASPTDDSPGAIVSEVKLYGDAVLRYVSYFNGFNGTFLPKYQKVDTPPFSYGLARLDHAVGNVHKLLENVQYIANFTGFHEFAEFTADDVGTAESGLNSMVLASNNELVLLPLNEPVLGTKRKSQIQTYLEHNEGPGLQHLALMSKDIFSTLKEMRQRTHLGGFDFMPKPPPTYYRNLRKRVADILSEAQMVECEELGILVDRDDQGVLLQIFTQPVGDRPTLFLEIIQRIGCMEESGDSGTLVQKGGCGGFGKGNFSELFKSIEEYEKTLEISVNSDH